ncbi:uncharacterized protein LOC113360707 [Papaver somniferum]|uniref:uncharacterized protein LOC113360707 n=1 Tax=Papaver somniferum TaxID=3469 RepID=UPI000E6FC854|nr:uncharacterized protein LOC113360707 [Papaver somniferum]
MELFEDPEFLNARRTIKELVKVGSVKEAFKIIVKASPTKFFLIFLILVLPLSLFQLLFEANTRHIVSFFTWDLIYKSSPEYLLSDQKLVSDSIHDCVYLVLFSTFYLLSTSAMTFTIAYLHVSKPLSSISVLSAIPRIFKRLAITFLHALPLIFLIHTAYLAVVALITLVITVIGTVPKTNYVLVSLLIIDIIFLLICFAFVLVARAHTVASWSSANVVSVLEPNTYGSAAIEKSKLLLEEKKNIKDILVLLHLGTEVLVCLVQAMLCDTNIIARVLIISLCVIALAAGNFLGLTAQNLMYYVCTGYDNQVIGKRVCDYCVLEKTEFGKDNRADKLEVNLNDMFVM